MEADASVGPSEASIVETQRHVLTLEDVNREDHDNAEVARILEAHSKTLADEEWTLEDDGELESYVKARLYRDKDKHYAKTTPVNSGIYRRMNEGPQWVTRAAVLFLKAVWGTPGLVVFDEAAKSFGFAVAAEEGINKAGKGSREPPPKWPSEISVMKMYEDVASEAKRSARSSPLHDRGDDKEEESIFVTQHTSLMFSPIIPEESTDSTGALEEASVPAKDTLKSKDHPKPALKRTPSIAKLKTRGSVPSTAKPGFDKDKDKGKEEGDAGAKAESGKTKRVRIAKPESDKYAEDPKPAKKRTTLGVTVPLPSAMKNTSTSSRADKNSGPFPDLSLLIQQRSAAKREVQNESKKELVEEVRQLALEFVRINAEARDHADKFEQRIFDVEAKQQEIEEQIAAVTERQDATESYIAQLVHQLADAGSLAP